MKRAIERDQDRVAHISQNLHRYKKEIGNLQTAAKQMSDEEARLERLHDQYNEAADKADEEAEMAKEQADRLDSEIQAAEVAGKCRT